MAYNKYDNDRQVSYMAGIPVKISEQFKPPKKITLPGAVINKLNAETVLPEYDFALERSVIDKMSQWRCLRHSQREARRQRVEEAKQTKVNTESPAKTEEKSPVPERAMSPSVTEPYPILTPQTTFVPVKASTQSTQYSRSFNFSDFEQDTSSPFDSVELKTINDKEELAHVLQSIVIDEKTKVKDDKKSMPPRLNGINVEHCSQLSSSYSWNNQIGQSYNNYYKDPHMTLPKIPAEVHNTITAVQSYVVQRLDVGETGSSSVPDILHQLELELRDKREAETRRNLEEPRRPASIGPAEVSHKPNDSPPQSTLPNPFTQLSEACQKLTNRLAEMGFPLPRVSRAAEIFGDDETKIVEFLVHVQRLEEMRYPGDRVEKALIANNFNETETVRYLDTAGELLGMGFSEEKVTQALAECGLDRDKTLDWLIS